MKTNIKISIPVKKYLKILFIILFVIALIFTLIFIVGNSILPDLLGTPTTDNNVIATSTINDRLLGQKAPEFDLPDNFGNRISLSSFINTPVVLVFWATWNGESADQIKILDDYSFNQKTQNSLIKVIAIDSLEDASIVKSFMKRGGYNVSIGLDISGNVSDQYNIKSLPTSYFIGKDGVVKDIYTGVLSKSMIVDKVENLLK